MSDLKSANDTSNPSDNSAQLEKLQENAYYITNHYYDLNNAANPWIVSGESSFDAIYQSGKATGTVVQRNARLVRRYELEKIAEVFEQPNNYSHAANILAQGRIVILVGSMGCGKRAAALHLGMRRSGFTNVFEISPRQVLVDLVRFTPEQDGATFVIDGASTNFLSDIDSFDLREIRTHLQEHDACLIVTATDLEHQITLDGEELVVRIDQRPTQQIERVLQRHLVFYAQHEQIELAKLQRIVNDHNLISSVITRDTRLRRIDEVALLVTQVVVERITLQDALSRLTIVNAEGVRHIFLEECKTLEERTFLLALAAFNGAAEDNVLLAAQLLRHFAPDIGVPQKTTEAVDPLSIEAQLYAKCHCRRKQLRVQTDLNIEFRTGLELDSPYLAPAILEYVWQNHRGMREPLIKWLSTISGSHDKSAEIRLFAAALTDDAGGVTHEIERIIQHHEMRVRAAAAVGELMRHDFSTIRRRIIHPWVRTGDPEMHLLVAVALMVPLWDESHRNTLLRLVYSWRRQVRNNRQDFFRAALVAYTQVGLRYVEEALKNLGESYCDIHEALTDGDTRLKPSLRAVVNAIGGIAQGGAKDGELIVGVIQYCDLWSSSDRAELRMLAAFAFLQVAKVSVREPRTDRLWASPLVVAARNDLDCARVARLFLNAIDHYDTYQAANDVFVQWGDRAQRDQQRLARAFDLVIRSMWMQGSDINRSRLEKIFRKHSDNPFFNRFLN